MGAAEVSAIGGERMKTFMALSAYEIKNIIRDKMTILMVVYPFFITAIAAFIIPTFFNFTEGEEGIFLVTSLIIIIILTSLAPMLAGAMLGFLLLDHKDEKTLDSIRVTPLSLRSYLIYKSGYTYLLSFFASAFVILGIRYFSGDGYTFLGQNVFKDLPMSGIITYALVSGLFGPTFGLIIATIGKNKIEGFAYLKSMGILVLLPALMMIEALQDFRQYLLGVIPGFWPVKGLLETASFLPNDANLPASLYFLVGALMMGLLIIIFIRQFEKNIA
jgi:fluoroquinolone transport system permease protein